MTGASDRILPQRIQYAVAELGEPRAEFGSTGAVGCAVCLLVLAVFAAIVIPVFANLVGFEDDEDREAVQGLTCAGVIVALVFLVGAAVVWSRRGQQVLVCPEGLVWARRHKVRLCRWEQLTEVRKREDRGAIVEVVLKQGEPWSIDTTFLTGPGKLATLLCKEVEQHGIPWHVVKKAK